MRFFRLPGQADPVPAHATGRSLDRGRRIGIVLRHSLYRNRITGIDSIPAAGPIVFVANHTNFIDGAVLFGLLPRRTSFLIKAEAVRGALGWVLNHVGQYAINRDAPQRELLLQAMDQLGRGGCIGVFPEGTRGTGLVRTVFNGAGWLAVRTGASVVPIAIRGTSRPVDSGRRFRPVVDISIGESFVVAAGSGKKAVDAATALIQQQLSAQVAELDARLSAMAGSS